MGKEILVEPENIWEYFIKHRDHLEETLVTVARNKEFGVEIFLTADHGDAELIVEADDDEVCSEFLVDADDALNSARKLYDTFLTNNVVNAIEDLRGFSGDEPDEEETIDERDAELKDAAYDFLFTVYRDYKKSVELKDDMVEDFLDAALQYLAETYNNKIYKPMFIKDDAGVEHYVEYPYLYLTSD